MRIQVRYLCASMSQLVADQKLGIWLRHRDGLQECVRNLWGLPGL